MVSLFLRLTGAALALLAFISAPTAARDDIRTERVKFQKGASSAVVEGSIKGYEVVDYVLGARNGQSMNVSMATNNGANYFIILAPGENAVAMFNGSVSQNQYEGILPKSGDYKIRIYMMRSAARRNEVAKYRLEMIISNAKATPAPSKSNSAGRAGQRAFDATGKIPCAQNVGQPMGQCDFGVTREANGSATVVITRADGRPRAIFFDNGVPVSADTSQADGYGKFKATKQSDLHMIQVGKERYEIPDAVIFGG